jgi:hypothetical protein
LVHPEGSGATQLRLRIEKAEPASNKHEYTTLPLSSACNPIPFSLAVH